MGGAEVSEEGRFLSRAHHEEGSRKALNHVSNGRVEASLAEGAQACLLGARPGNPSPWVALPPVPKWFARLAHWQSSAWPPRVVQAQLCLSTLLRALSQPAAERLDWKA